MELKRKKKFPQTRKESKVRALVVGIPVLLPRTTPRDIQASDGCLRTLVWLNPPATFVSWVELLTWILGTIYP